MKESEIEFGLKRLKFFVTLKPKIFEIVKKQAIAKHETISDSVISLLEVELLNKDKQ